MSTRLLSRSPALLLGGILLATSPDAAAQWSPGPSLANARHGPGVVRHGGDIYAVGGWYVGTSLEVLYSGATSWVSLAPLPTPQEGLAAAVVGDEIYTFGSYGFADTCQIYDIASDTWQAGPPVPVRIYWSTAEAVGTDIYLIAGYVYPGPPGTGSDLLFILDTTNNTWSQGASLPVGIQIPASVRHGQFIYVFGSFLHYGVYAYVKYDLVGGTWSTFTGPPSGHGGTSEAVSDGQFVFLMGGSPGNIYTAYQTVEVYDPLTDTWTTGPSLIDGRYQFGAVYLPNEGNIYAVAGRDETASSMTSVEVLSVGLPSDPSDVTALRIAKLTARVDWTDNSWDEAGFQVERERRVGNSWQETTTFVVGPGVVTHTDEVTVKGRYRYRVQAFNGSGTSSWSNWAEVNLTH